MAVGVRVNGSGAEGDLGVVRDQGSKGTEGDLKVVRDQGQRDLGVVWGQGLKGV